MSPADRPLEGECQIGPDEIAYLGGLRIAWIRDPDDQVLSFLEHSGGSTAADVPVVSQPVGDCSPRTSQSEMLDLKTTPLTFEIAMACDDPPLDEPMAVCVGGRPR